MRTLLLTESLGKKRGGLSVGTLLLAIGLSKQFPNDICSVVYQKNQISFINRILEIIPVNIPGCQFSWTCDSKPDDLFIDKTAWENSQKIAEEVLNGLHHDLSEGATHYHAHYVKPSWASSKTYITRIDDHIFYRWDISY